MGREGEEESFRGGGGRRARGCGGCGAKGAREGGRRSAGCRRSGGGERRRGGGEGDARGERRREGDAAEGEGEGGREERKLTRVFATTVTAPLSGEVAVTEMTPTDGTVRCAPRQITWRSSAAATATRTDGGGSPSIPSPRILTVCAIPRFAFSGRTSAIPSPRAAAERSCPGNSMQQSICALRGFEQSFGTEESFWQVRRLTEPKKVRPVAANWTATASPGFAPNRLIPCNGSLHRPVPLSWTGDGTIATSNETSLIDTITELAACHRIAISVQHRPILTGKRL